MCTRARHGPNLAVHRRVARRRTSPRLTLANAPPGTGDEGLAGDLLLHETERPTPLTYDPLVVGRILLEGDRLAAAGQLTDPKRDELLASLRAAITSDEETLRSFLHDVATLRNAPGGPARHRGRRAARRGPKA